MRGLLKFVLFTCFLLAGAFAVNALNTHVNITIGEVVNQNITYARYFYLLENQTYLLIDGTLTINNPGAETVFDIDVDLTNVETSTGFNHDSGRFGNQTVYYQAASDAEYGAIAQGTIYPLNASSYVWSSSPGATQDIDDDGNVDYITVNSTHVLINMSHEGTLAIRLYNTGGNVDISNAGAVPVLIEMETNITTLGFGDDTIENLGVINITGTTSTNDQIDAGVLVNITDNLRSIVRIHVPELRSGQSSVFKYNLSGSITPPLDIDTNYTHQYNRKVLAGESFTINDSIQNVINLGLDVTNINITIDALNITWNGSDFNFTLSNLSSFTGSDHANVYGNGTDFKRWYWLPNAGTLPYGSKMNITYEVTAPYSVYTTGQYAAVMQTLQYQVAYAASNITVADVKSRAQIRFNTTKEIVSPADNQLNRNVTWRSIPRVGSTENITYTITKVTLWVTTTLDPNQDTGMTTTYDADTQINLTTPWTLGESNPWYFNFTDGSSSAYPPPIIWIKPYWIITNAFNQIVNQSYTVNGTDLYIKYIYVINGYWLEVDKNITSIDDDTYRLDVWVHNRGNGWTPQNMTVTVYDFVPQAFTAWNFTLAPNNQSNVTGEFSGAAYQWDVGLKAPYLASLAPDDGAPGGNDEWNTTYYVNGSGDYVVSDLYIVGLDPRKVDGAGASPAIAIVSQIKSNLTETIYLGIVLGLIALNAVNLVMTRKIDKKLDKHNKQTYDNIVNEMKNLREKK